MNQEQFVELCEGIRQAKAVRRGQAAPSRVWCVTRAEDGKLRRRQLDPKAYQLERRTEWENTAGKTRSKLHLAQS